MIKIMTEKVVRSDGEKGFCIEKIQALREDKVPEIYLKSKDPVVFLCGKEERYLVLRHRKTEEIPYSVWEKSFYNVQTMISIVDHCCAAGINLQACKKELKKLEKEWNGKQTFNI